VAKYCGTVDRISAAIRLLTEGYIVWKAPAPALAVATTPTIPAEQRTQSKPKKEQGKPPTKQSDDPLDLMTLKQFCRRAAISRSLAYLHIQRGDLKVTKIGRATRISGASAREWLAKFT
jgi:hypothetical protein